MELEHVQRRASVVSVTDDTFEEEVLRSELPVLIDLYADWCQPCKQLSPIVARVAEELAGKLKVVEVDIDRNPMVAQSFRVQSVPMLVVISEGQVAGHHLGMLDERELLQLLEPVLPVDAQQVEPADLAKMIAAGRAVAVDIRDARSFDRFHIPGALHVDATDLRGGGADGAVADARIRVLYSRTTDEAKELAARLGEEGVRVFYLAGGFLHWESDALEVERGG